MSRLVGLLLGSMSRSLAVGYCGSGLRSTQRRPTAPVHAPHISHLDTSLSPRRLAASPPTCPASVLMALGSLWGRLRSQQLGVAKTKAWGLATWIPIVVWFNLHVAELTTVQGPSMYPLFNEDRDSTLRRDVILNYKWAPQKGLERGMIVTLRSPTHPEIVAVKRVTALEGDVVRTRQPYPTPTVRIPAGHVWVEGDGPPGSSLDSNTYGPVSMRLLTGRVTHVVYPLRKFGRVRWWEHERRLLEE